MLRIQPSGHKSYYYVFTIYGRTPWYNIGWIPLADARHIAAGLRLAIADGRDPQEEKLTKRGVDRSANRADAHENSDTKLAVAAVRNFAHWTSPLNVNIPIVYFVLIGQAIKIGFTTKLQERLRGLQGATAVEIKLVAAFPGSRELEQQFHRELSAARITGEFFHADVVMKFLAIIVPERLRHFDEEAKRARSANAVSPSRDEHRQPAPRGRTESMSDGAEQLSQHPMSGGSA